MGDKAKQPKEGFGGPSATVAARLDSFINARLASL